MRWPTDTPPVQTGDTRPVPDPTSLTTDQLRREIETLRELIEARLDGADALTADRFAGIAIRFAMAEAQRVEQKADNQAALTAALETKDEAVKAAFESSEKAIAKAEISIEKRADATYVALGELQRLLTGLMPRSEAESRFGNSEEKAVANASRIDRLEGQKGGGEKTVATLIAAASVILTVIIIGVSLFIGLRSKGSTTVYVPTPTPTVR